MSTFTAHIKLKSHAKHTFSGFCAYTALDEKFENSGAVRTVMNTIEVFMGDQPVGDIDIENSADKSAHDKAVRDYLNIFPGFNGSFSWV